MFRNVLLNMVAVAVSFLSCEHKNPPPVIRKQTQPYGISVPMQAGSGAEHQQETHGATQSHRTDAGTSPRKAVNSSEVTHRKAVSSPADLTRLSNGLLAFSLNILKKLAEDNPNRNVLVSPYSVAAAFSMLYGGTKGETATQIGRVMEFAPNPRQHALFHALSDSLAPGTRGPSLEVAYGIWIMKGFSLQPAYRKLVEANYSAALETLDFSRSEKAVERINTWVTRKTHHMIKNLLSPSNVGVLTRLVIVNALYFHGIWQRKFIPALTRPASFHAPGGDIQVSMMHQAGIMPFYEGSINGRSGTGYRVVRLAYSGEGWSLMILLPRSSDPARLMDIVRGLSPDDIRKWLKHSQEKYVSLALPRFTMSGRYRLREVLTSMGITKAFTPDQADLGGLITGGKTDEELYVSDVFHKTRMDVYEEGTRAAAATATVAVGTGAPVKYIDFVCNHPFMVFLVNEPTFTILFTGIVAAPISP